MYIPEVQSLLAAGLALTSTLTSQTKVASGKVLDFSVEKCLDDNDKVRCTKPFLVTKSTCYEIKWSTSGTFSHTTAEVRDAGSDELVFYRDTDGKWTPKKGELVYMDFKPKIPGTGDDKVEYEVWTCE